jgi:nuclear protein localization protein 4 homolog
MTVSDFVAMDSQYEFKIQRQKEAICKQVSLDVPSISQFQSYLQHFQFQRKRIGYLYGRFVTEDGKDPEEVLDTDNNNVADGTTNKKLTATKVLVEAIYEPPQEVDNEAAEGVVPADEDQWEAAVEQIASCLGWKKVGWIYGHEAREPGFAMSAAEVIMAAEYQLEAADGVNETPFVTVKVSPATDGRITVEAFQVSQQCMAMVAEEALEVGSDAKCCKVNETFTAIQEGKASPTVENNFFLTVVPIVQHTSDKFIADFPRLNRDVDDRTPSNDELKHQLSKSGTAGWTFVDRLADFNLLIYLSQYLDIQSDLPKICTSISDRSRPLDDGYKILIKSIAGLEGSY